MSNEVMSGFAGFLFVFILLLSSVKGQGQCTDKLNNCEQYGASACTNYKQWATENCCGYCRLSPNMQSGCVDKLTNCAEYGTGICTSYTKWASTNCCKYCADNVLPSSGTVRPGMHVSLCNDKLANCPSYGDDICHNFRKWAGDNCCAFCRAIHAQNPLMPSTTSAIHASSALPISCRDDFSETTCQHINACNDAKDRQYCKRYCNLCCHDMTSGNCSRSDACASIVSALKCKQTCGLCQCQDKLDCSSLRRYCLIVDEITLKCPDTCGLCGDNSAIDVFG